MNNKNDLIACAKHTGNLFIGHLLKTFTTLNFLSPTPAHNYLFHILTQRIGFSIFATAIWEIQFPVIPVNLAVEEPGILDGKYDPAGRDDSGEASNCRK